MDDKSSILNVDGPSVLKIELDVPRRELERKFKKLLLAAKVRREQSKLLTPDTFPFVIFKLRTTSDDPLPDPEKNRLGCQN
jgi:hypothetical protein